MGPTSKGLLLRGGWLGSRVVSVLDSGAEGPGSNRSWVYDSHHVQADCQEPGSVPEPYAR